MHKSLTSSNITLPEYFSWREASPSCMVPVIDQGECGSCYAHAVTSMLAERLCIEESNKTSSNETVRPLSPNYIMTCEPDA